jgi:hypothetical protein
LDVNLSKNFLFDGKTFSAQMGLFNILNSSVVLSEVQTFGASLGRPQRFLQGRTMRLGMQLKW